MKQLAHIGTIELVSLPDDDIQAVPAKIDTGADSSSIWASNVTVKNGKLKFNFFAPGSVFYRQEPVITTAFRVTRVRNSFGTEEFRYKIRLSITVGEHTVKRWVSLADRSRNTYPILLGRNFLHKRFVVDVSKKHLLSQAQSAPAVLAVGASKSQALFKAVRAQNSVPIRYDCIGYDSLVYHIDGLNTHVYNQASTKPIDIADYNLTYFKSRDRHQEAAIAAAEYLHFRGKPFIDQELRQTASQSKLSEYMKLASHNLPVPPTLAMATSLLIKNYERVVKTIGSPFVLKEIASDRGQNNFLISNQTEFKKILKKAKVDEIYVAQKYIPNDGFVRAYVLGQEVGPVVFRTPHTHKDPLRQHLNKPSGGANAKLITASEVASEIRELAAAAAHCMERQIVGVDLLQDKSDGTWYILEVNHGPQLRSGAFVTEKASALAQFFDKEINR